MQIVGRDILAEFIFWLHFVIVLFWFGLFLVPSGLWAAKIPFHFFITVVIAGHQFIWGAVILPWAKRYRMVCILTTLTHILRGQKISDPKNYTHSFTVGFIKRFGLNVSNRVSTLFTCAALIWISLQYFVFR